MKLIEWSGKAVSFLVMGLAMMIALPVWAQSGATLLAITDLDCNWKLDGKPQGALKADDAKLVPVSLGKHLVQATSTDGQDEWKTVVNVSEAGQEMVEIKLKAAHQKRAAETDLQQNPTWTDPASGLMWARQDNGTDVNWNQANSYCQNLRLASYSNWRLPTIDELAGIYDQTQNVNGRHIKGGIRLLVSAPWSNSVVKSGFDRHDAALVLSFSGAGEKLTVLPYAIEGVLCVRRSGE